MTFADQTGSRKDQLRAIHILHENFARSLASSLSAYLRAYVAVNLVVAEQLSFLDFSQNLPSPSCLVFLGMKPHEDNTVLEINPGLVFPIIEMLLGGGSRSLHDLQTAWHAVTPLEFTIEAHTTEAQLLRILLTNEAVIAASMEVRIDDNVGMMNIGVSSRVVKTPRHKFDQQWSVPKSESTEQEQARIMRLIRPAKMFVDGRLDGPTLRVEELMDLRKVMSLRSIIRLAAPWIWPSAER